MWTQADIDRLKKAIASGVRQVMESGRMVTYASVDEQMRVLRMMEAEVAGASASRNIKATFSRGDG